MSSLLSSARRLVVALAVLAGLLLPVFLGANAADAATARPTCAQANEDFWYRHNHPYWWAHHCPKMAAAMGAAKKAAAAAATHTTTAVVHPAVTRGSAPEQYIAWAVFNAINAQRVANHLRPLVMDPNLVWAAQRHNMKMAVYNTMSHQLPGEPSLGDRLDAVGYRWTWAGENVAWNSQMTTQGVLALQGMMYEEKAPNDGHRQNILNPNFTGVGVQVVMDNTHHKVWLTTDFGRK